MKVKVISNKEWIEKRVQNIWEGVCELDRSGKEIPKEWIAELQTHIGRLKNDITVSLWREQIYSTVEDFIFNR